MLIITIERVPDSDPSRRHKVGEIRLTDDGTGDAVHSNYDVLVRHCGRHWGKPGEWRRAKLKSVHRFHNLYRVLAAALAVCGFVNINVHPQSFEEFKIGD